MVDLRVQERLLPALLDRLTDNQAAAPQRGTHRGTNPGSGERWVMTMNQFREAVVRDLCWLLGTTSFDAVQSLDRYPHVRNSVLNYGTPDLTGCTSADLNLREFEKRLKQAILDFEPRLTRKTVKVRAETGQEDTAINCLTFHIEAELWGKPVPIQLFLKTEINLESGDVEIVESSGAD